EALALAGEELHAELGLELLQLLADARLARIQPFRGSGDVQPAVDDADQILELLQRQRDSLGEKSRASRDGAGGGLGFRIYNRRLQRVSTEWQGSSVVSGISSGNLRLGG